MVATQTWVSGNVGDWSSPSNWISGIPPATGDFAIINSGFPTIGEGSSIVGITITLGGLQNASPVTLAAIDSTFAAGGGADMQLLVNGGHPVTSPLRALFLIQGSTTFDGQIFVEPLGGSLTIEAVSNGQTPGNFIFADTDGKAVMVVSQESLLVLKGETITNDGLIQVDGGLDITEGVTVGGTGIILLENGGQLTVDGTVLATQHVSFADGTGDVTIADAEDFSGIFGFTSWGGNEISFQGIDADAMSFVHNEGATTALLTLLGESGSGTQTLATLTVQLIDDELFAPLAAKDQTLTGFDFSFASDGKGGTVVTYTPQGPLVLQQSLPVPIIADATTPVSLSSILMQAFGTATPAFQQIILEPTQPAPTTPTNWYYWEENFTAPQWTVNGALVTTSRVVNSGDIVELVAGNQIDKPAQFKALMTPPGASNPVYVEYNVWTVETAVHDLMVDGGYAGLPTPEAISASANAFLDTYGLVLNNNLCNWIADNVGAGAGASMPGVDAQLDPADNIPGGFWRIVYSGADPDPVANWSSKVREGDIVRMGWLHPEDPTKNPASGHSTTVLAGLNSEGKIEVYDNIFYKAGGGPSYIGIHEADYWNGTNPADITIYRLDPAQQYLIQGSAFAEQVQGSVFSDLIQPGGGADTITGGPGNNEIQGTVAELASITITDFGPGDLLDFTDLAASRATVKFDNGSLLVFDNGTQVATVTMPAPGHGDFFFVASDGDKGTNIGLVDPATQIEMLYIGYLGRAGDPGGVEYWHSQLLAQGDTRATLKKMAESFAVQPETSTAYPFFANPQQATSAEITSFITAQYQELFGRAPDAGGLAYWQTYLQANLASPQAVGAFPLALIFGAMNTSSGVPGSPLSLDLTTIGNKTTVGAYMVEQFAAAHIDFGSGSSLANTFAHEIIDHVDYTADSVTAAEAAVLAFIESQMELVGVQG